MSVPPAQKEDAAVMSAQEVDREALCAEYHEAIELIARVRGASTDSCMENLRHWEMPASRICADFFCCADHPRLGWCGFLADSSGHGLPSAIFALHLPMLFRESVFLGKSLAGIYSRIHQFLLEQRLPGYFVCGTLVRVDGREIEVINAGMPDALLLDGKGCLLASFPSASMPFGIDAGSSQHETESGLQRYRLANEVSASLLLYSDGLQELGILDGQALGRDGLLTAASAGPESLFDTLVARVQQNPGAVHDDVSITLIPVPMQNKGTQFAILDADKVAPLPEQAVTAAAVRIVAGLDRGLMLTNADQRIVYVNPSFTAITGYTLEEAVGQTPRLLNSGRHDFAFYRDMWQSLREWGEWHGEIWNQRKDGSLYLEWLDLRVLRDDAGTVVNYLGTFTVIEQHQQQDERLYFMALHDPLTGLANRALLVDRSKQAIRAAEQARAAGGGEGMLALLFIDLDRFKVINESLGYATGDEVLIEVARRLGTVVSTADTLAHLGGDEFICLIPGIADRETTASTAGKMLAALAAPIEVAGHQIRIGASIGIGLYPADGLFFDDLMAKADQAMVKAKRAGGNLCCFHAAEAATG